MVHQYWQMQLPDAVSNKSHRNDISGSASWQKLALILRCRQRCLMTTWQTLQCLGTSGKYVFHASIVVPKGSDPTKLWWRSPWEIFEHPPFKLGLLKSEVWSIQSLFVSIATVDARQHANSDILLRMECSSHMFTIYRSDLEACGDVPYMDGIPSWRWIVVKNWKFRKGISVGHWNHYLLFLVLGEL